VAAVHPANLESDEQRARLQRALGDGYEVREPIGSGGFATVFAAFDRELKREVAVKVLRPELEAPIFRQRFRREAESVAQLRHPHIVPIYAVGEADGLAYLVMPHVRGESLQQRLEREGKLSIDDATRILRDAAGASYELLAGAFDLQSERGDKADPAQVSTNGSSGITVGARLESSQKPG